MTAGSRSPTTPSPPTQAAPFTTDGDGRTCEITGLTNGTNYTITVTATNAIGTSTDSTPTTTTVTAGAPRRPAGVAAGRDVG